MPAPFPGMDPFLEQQEWEDFHTRWNTAIAETLAPRLAPNYLVRIERRMPEERQETFLVVRDRPTLEVVTVIETLSPANKRAGGDGRREYLQKREEILQSPSYLVELDLLRGGRRLPMAAPLPPADYYAIVSRHERRPRAAVYAWSLGHELPTIPIPRRKEDSDAPLPLQSVFDSVYERARYELSLDYDRPLVPPPAESDSAWIAQRLAAWREQRGG